MATETNNPVTEPGANPEPQNQNPNPDPKPTEKTFTQQEVNAMMAREKSTARQAMFKELGLEYDEKSYKTSLENAKKTLDAGKTQAQLDADARKIAEKDLAETQKRAGLLETKVAALSAGVKPDFLDDIITLAMPKVDDKTPLDAVLKSLKERYPTSFVDAPGDNGNGTGNPTNPARKNGDGQESMGKRLAKSASRPPAKSSYFRNNNN